MEEKNLSTIEQINKAFYSVNGSMVFCYGNEAYKYAAKIALLCPFFTLDVDEDELIVSNQKPSCYNCLFRKWTKDSFICMKGR